MVFFLLPVQIFTFEAIVMQIGQVAVTQGDPLQDMQFFLLRILCLEVLRGKQPSLKQALKLRTDPLLT